MKKLLVFIVSVALMLCSTVLASPEQIWQIETVSETVSEQANDTATLTANFDEGNGTKESPYIISTAEQLLGVANIVKNSTQALYFKLASDIDLEGVEWTPIGTQNSPFSGAFDGDGYTVSNLKITTPQEYSGFFGIVKEADISRLSIENMTIDFEYSSISHIYAGLLFASALKTNGNKELTNIFSENCVSGSIDITSKSSAVTAGGIAGKMETKTGNYVIRNSISLVDINVVSESNDVYAGGIIGRMRDYVSSYEMSVEKSYYYGSCTAKADNDTVYAGGIAGYIWSNGPYGGWYSDGDATLLSSNDTEYSIKNCFASGSVYASGSASDTNIGRIHGTENDSATIKNCAYVATQTISALAGGKPYTSYTGTPSKITTLSSTYLSNTLGFNLINIWEIDNEGICKYPYLKSFGIPNITGDINRDLQVNSDDLEILANHIADISVITDEDALKCANIYTQSTDSKTDLASNLNIKDLILLAQYIA